VEGSSQHTAPQHDSDLTDKYHQTKARLDAALKAGLAGTFFWDIRKDLVITDKSLQHYFSISPKALTEGLPLSEFLPAIYEEDRPLLVIALNEAIEKTGSYFLEYRVNHPDGHIRWLSARGQVEYDASGTAIALPGFVVDITKNKEAEQKLKGTNILLKKQVFENEQLLIQKDEFISIASHELKTPLTSIKIYGETLQERFEQSADSESAGVMEKMNTQINRLTQLINDLLDTSKIVEGKMLLDIEQVDLNELITERIEDLQQITQKHKLILMTTALEPVSADRKRIGQVITNLISNAIKYSPNEGEIIITSELAGDTVRVSIRDHGIGIPVNMIDKVFDRFFRADNTVQTYPGMGLGLYISAGIIRRHNGTIAAESEEGQGSLFSFTLPLVNISS
jgi:signal transduction histidine kinase